MNKIAYKFLGWFFLVFFVGIGAYRLLIGITPPWMDLVYILSVIVFFIGLSMIKVRGKENPKKN